MELITYRKPDAFLAVAQADLEAHEVENSVILGVIARIARYPEHITAQPYMTIMRDAERFVMTATMTPPFKLVLSFAPTYDRSVLECIAEDLYANGWNVPGVRAPNDGAQMFSEIWQKVTGRSYRIGLQMRAFRLTTVVPPQPMPPGFSRAITPADRDLVSTWLTAFHDEALSNDPPINPATLVEQAIANQSYWLWDNGGIVSMAARARPTRHGITINAVYTPPDQRGKGYATANVAALSQRNLDDGYQFCTLNTDVANPISNSIYQKIGYRPVCDNSEYWFK